MATKPKHFGVYCDGPHCTSKGFCSWVTGDRYKCAICPDFDLCATCEASPLNKHNSTHPFIKFKSPVRSVTVQTLDAETSIRMGDRVTGDTRSVSSSVIANASTSVQTIAETKPTEEIANVHSAPQISEKISVGEINETVEQEVIERDEESISESGYVDNTSTPKVVPVEQTDEEKEQPKGEQNKVEPKQDTQRAEEQQEGEPKGEEQKKEGEQKEQQKDGDQQMTEELNLEGDMTDLIKSHTSQMIFPTLDKESTAPSTSGSSANIADAPVDLTYEEVPSPAVSTVTTTNEGHGEDDASDVYSVDELDDLENFISDDEDYEVWEASDGEEFGSSNSSTA